MDGRPYNTIDQLLTRMTPVLQTLVQDCDAKLVEHRGCLLSLSTIKPSLKATLIWTEPSVGFQC